MRHVSSPALSAYSRTWLNRPPIPSGLGLTDTSVLLGYLIGFVLSVIAVIVAEMALSYYFKGKEKTKVDIHSHIKEHDFGIQVDSMNKTLKEARVILNGVQYPWIMADGSEVQRRDIFVGEEPPAIFIPFRIESSNITNEFPQHNTKGISAWLDVKAPKRLTDPLPAGAHAMLYVLSEKKTNKVFAQFILVTSERARSVGSYNMGSGLNMISEARISIRVIAEGIEELREYVLALNLLGLSFVPLGDGEKAMVIALDLKQV